MRRAVHGNPTITSRHGQRTNMGMYGKHLGYDYLVVNQPVVAPESMVITGLFYGGSGGNYIEARGKYTHRFLHLSRHSVFKRFNVSVGQTIPEGTEFARSGNTGVTTGAHLHHDTRKNGTSWNSGFDNYVDWENIIAVAPPPVPGMPPVGSSVRFTVSRTAFVAGTTTVKGTLLPDIRIVRGYDPTYSNRILVNSASVGNGVAVALYYTNGVKIDGWKLI